MVLPCSSRHVLTTTYVLYIFLLLFSFSICYLRDSITLNESIRDSQNETLVSAGERFQLGFFNPERSKKRYLGIWYYKIVPQTVVWIANRNHPLEKTNGVFSITKDGELGLTGESSETIFRSPNVGGRPAMKWKLTLMDSGNLVFSEEEHQGNVSESKILWQSFDNPTDTFVPGMKMTVSIKLTSWKSKDDPAEGNFTFLLDPERDNQYIIEKGSYVQYWKSQSSQSLSSFDDISPVASYMLSNFTRRFYHQTDNSKRHTTRGTNGTTATSYKLFNSSITYSKASDYINTRLVMNFTGQIQFFQGLVLVQSEPSDPCRVFKACGQFSSCNSKNAVFCKCLPGFKPKSPESWNSGDFSGGCESNSELCRYNDTFLNLTMMKAGKRGVDVNLEQGEDCRTKCLNDCHCNAYSYAPRCLIWSDGLDNLQEFSSDGHGINVRVALSDIGNIHIVLSL